MTEYENLLEQACAEYEGIEYRKGGKGSWAFSGAMPSKFSQVMVGRYANRGLVPTANYTEHLLSRRAALTTLIQGKEEGKFEEMSADMLYALRLDRNEIDCQVVVDHMLLAAKVIHRCAPDANDFEVDEMLSLASEKIITCIAVQDRECKFSTYVWAAMRNLVYTYSSRIENWDTVAIDEFNDSSLSGFSNKVVMPGQFYMEQVADEASGPQVEIQKKELMEALGRVLEFRSDFLTEQEEQVLASWTGLGFGYGGCHPVSQRTIANEMGMTAQRVQKVLTSALSKVEAKLGQINEGSDLTFYQKYIEE